MRNRLARVVDRLLSDSEFLDRFRENPESVLRPYRLSDVEVEALKRGDAAELERLGVEVQLYMADPPAPARSVWLSSPAGRLAIAVFTALVMVVGPGVLAAAPAHAARRHGARRRVRARHLQVRMGRLVRHARASDVRAGRYLRRHVRHLGRRYVKNGTACDPSAGCVEPIR